MSQRFTNPVAAAITGSQLVLPFLNSEKRLPMRALVVYLGALLLVFHSKVAVVTSQPSNWPTLTGGQPMVIARGGFSGMYPDSSYAAYSLAWYTGIPDYTAMWCDLQFTADQLAICFPNLTLEDSTNIEQVFPEKQTTKLVHQLPTSGYFSLDYKFDDFLNVRLKQRKESRTKWFDYGKATYILTVENMSEKIISAGSTFLWLNIQHPSFYDSNGINVTSHVLNLTSNLNVTFISSPDMDFLAKIQPQIDTNTTKLVFFAGDENEMEPSTKKTYGSLLKDLEHVKTFAYGILMPKSYIWPVDKDRYLQPRTSIVSDAHKLGIAIYASGFMNDDKLSYNYSYDPISEYLNFIDNDDFSVDGVMSDHTITAADAIYCFSKHAPRKEIARKTLIISKEGASGDYPGCTDKAYHKAIDDGVDILDCPVQMSKDGTPFCLGSINLMDRTTIAQSIFTNRSISSIPEINVGNGIYAFSLTWDEIQTLTPEMSSPFSYYKLARNPKHKNEGKFQSLSDFLALASNKSSLTGILINITNAAYLAEHQGLGVIDAVLDALTKAGYDKKKEQIVMIQSTNSSVLKKFKGKGNYELVYHIDEEIGDVSASTVDFITKFAHSVVIKKTSVFPENKHKFLNSSTQVVKKLKQSGVGVYVETFNNEFVSQPRDFLADPYVEMDAYVTNASVDGLITAFPKTAASYKKNKCRKFINDRYGPGYFKKISTDPASEAPPSGVLTVSDVAEPPLPLVSDKPPSTAGGPQPAAAPKPPNGQPATCVLILSLVIMFLSDFFCL